jgi:lipid II:glycine glycyltransferase (peptidoglycan interpeptide bridge formation enzyme)
MNRFRIVDEREKERFDAFVQQAGGHACQAFGGGEPERVRGWQPLNAILEENGRIVATMVALRKPVGRWRRWCLMDVMNGPVADFSDEAAARRVIRAAARFAGAQGALDLKINPFVEKGEGLQHVLAAEGFRPARRRWRYRVTLRISLAEPIEKILAGMDARTRGYLQRDDGRGVQVSAVRHQQDIEDFVELYLRTCARKGLTARSPEYLRALCADGQHTRLFVARAGEGAAQALLAYAFAGRLVLAYAGSDHPCPPRVGRHLHWWAMQWGKEHGFVEYDQGGIPANPHPGDNQWGVYSFKRHFGGRRVELTAEYERFILPALTGAAGHLLDTFSRLRPLRSPRRAPSNLPSGVNT